jgi:hypothetical protein
VTSIGEPENPQAAKFGALAIGPDNLSFTMFTSSSTAIGLAELPQHQASAVYTVALDGFGVGTGNPNDGTGAQTAVAFVPTAGGTQALAVSDARGHWYELTYAAEQSWFAVSAAPTTVTLANAGYGIGYVPMGSPGFTESSVLVGGSGTVNVYALDASGTPIVSTRRPFYAQFGGDAMRAEAFDPATGDLLFATVMTSTISIVQGFAPIL